jgi:two-component system, LytTR family, sensor kinase
LAANPLGRVVLLASGWTAIGFVFAIPALSTGAGGRALFTSIISWWAWGLLAPAITGIDRRLPVSERQLPLRILAHVLPSFLLTSFYFYLLVGLRALFGLGKWSALWHIQTIVIALRGMFLWSWLVYWLVLGCWKAYQYYTRYLSAELQRERLERSFSEARLNVLRMQLDPHFIFNALNTISSQLERDPRLARGMIEHLGDLLRLSLESKDKQEVPLAEEMAFLDHYLAIQKIRFGEHLKIGISVAAEVKYASVPCLLVQPLVENAIRHGISRRSSGGTVNITARRVDDRLEIRVQDDGVGLPTAWSAETCNGLGLAATRERIEGLYPHGQGEFTINRRDGGGTEVEIVFPFRLADEVTNGIATN